MLPIRLRQTSGLPLFAHPPTPWQILWKCLFRTVAEFESSWASATSKADLCPVPCFILVCVLVCVCPLSFTQLYYKITILCYSARLCQPSHPPAPSPMPIPFPIRQKALTLNHSDAAFSNRTHTPRPHMCTPHTLHHPTPHCQPHCHEARSSTGPHLTTTHPSRRLQSAPKISLHARPPVPHPPRASKPRFVEVAPSSLAPPFHSSSPSST